MTQEDQVVRLFRERSGPLDHMVTTAADIEGAYQLLPALEIAAARKVVDSNSSALCCSPNILSRTGSITFTSGIAAYRPAPGLAVAAVNGALASLAAALAVELGPIRINVLSPGWVDTPIWAQVAGDARQQPWRPWPSACPWAASVSR